MPDTGGYSSRKAGWRTSLQGKQRLVRSVINGSGKHLGTIPCGTGWVKGHIFFLCTKTFGRLFGLLHSAFAFAIAAPQAWSGTTSYLPALSGVCRVQLYGS